MIKKIICIFSILLLLTGCWDQRSLKHMRLPTILGFDAKKNGDVYGTFLIRVPVGTSKGEEGVENELLTVIGDSLAEVHAQVDRKSSEKTNYSQVQVMLLGEEYAKKNFGEFIDSYITLAKSSYVAQVAIVSGEASKALKIRKGKEPLLDEYLGELVKTGMKLGITPNATSKIIHTLVHDEGHDNIVPYIEHSKQKDFLKLAGAALINDRHFTGQVLDPEKTELLLADLGIYGKRLWIANSKELDKSPFIIKDANFKKTVHQNSEGTISVDVNLNMEIHLQERDINRIKGKDNMKKMNELFSKYYTDLSKEMFNELQDADCDALGFGRDLIAFHPELWEKVKGKDYFQKIQIKPEVKVEIKSTNMKS